MIKFSLLNDPEGVFLIMSDDCTSDLCSACHSECGDRKAPGEGGEAPSKPDNLLASPHEMSRIGKVIGVLSGKGGVGKSLVTALLAAAERRRGASVGIMDADITGPSIPRLFGLSQRVKMDEFGLYPVETAAGISVVSLNLMIDHETDPVIWRGPVIGGLVKQFWTEVIWKDIDYLFIDMPPGTGDVPLTVFQTIPLSGLVIVTSPQELVTMIVGKAVNMARMMQVPILGLVENMSYFQCPDCGREVTVFGKSRAEEAAAAFGLGHVSRLPLQPDFARACDLGQAETIEGPWLDELLARIELLPPAVPH
jgi:Mrp family chromosome partitioning ATPase